MAAKKQPRTTRRAAPATPRGIRLNNPGNLEQGPPWQGLADDQPDKRFAKFETAPYGIRAIARTIITYQDKRQARDGSKIDTIREVIERWAPPTRGGKFENDTAAYYRHVAQLALVGENDLIDVHQYAVMEPMVKGIILHENGVQPYSQAQIDQGLALAGILPEKPALAKSRTIKGGQVAGIGGIAGVATGVSQLLQDNQPAVGLFQMLAQHKPTLVMIFLFVLALAGAGYMVYARWDDRRRLAR